MVAKTNSTLFPAKNWIPESLPEIGLKIINRENIVVQNHVPPKYGKYNLQYWKWDNLTYNKLSAVWNKRLIGVGNRKISKM